MLDLPRLKRIRLMKRPIGQLFFGYALLGPNYRFLPGVDIQLEGLEKIPNEPVIFAMNHTDRFNYFPFMYKLWKLKDRYMTVWHGAHQQPSDRVARIHHHERLHADDGKATHWGRVRHSA